MSTIQAAVWPECTRLSMVPGLSGWAECVQESTEAGADRVDAWDLPSLLAPFPGQRLDLLKVDIEGAEARLFGERADVWMDRVDLCAAELHASDCVAAFHRVFTTDRFVCHTCGELTIAVRQAR